MLSNVCVRRVEEGHLFNLGLGEAISIVAELADLDNPCSQGSGAVGTVNGVWSLGTYIAKLLFLFSPALLSCSNPVDSWTCGLLCATANPYMPLCSILNCLFP